MASPPGGQGPQTSPRSSQRDPETDSVSTER